MVVQMALAQELQDCVVCRPVAEAPGHLTEGYLQQVCLLHVIEQGLQVGTLGHPVPGLLIHSLRGGQHRHGAGRSVGQVLTSARGVGRVVGELPGFREVERVLDRLSGIGGQLEGVTPGPGSA